MPMGSIRDVDYTPLNCNDLPRTTVFYQDVRRFPNEIELENWVNVRTGSLILSVRTEIAQGGFANGPHEDGSASV